MPYPTRPSPVPILLAGLSLAACGGDGGTEPAGPFVGSISGSVLHAETGEPVAGATVATDPATTIVQTGGDGRFLIQGIEAGSGSTVPDGAFEVRASGAGFSDAVVPVTLSPSVPDVQADLELTVTLASVAALRGLPVGTALAAHLMRSDSRYREVAGHEFSSVTPENELKFQPLRPSRNSFDFGNADQIVDFAEAHGMRIHGHVLLWHNQLPDWLTDSDFSRTELLAILEDHITTVVTRYRGRIASWDVVNEVIADDGSGLRTNSFWIDEVGPEVIDSAFHWAHAADPDARLYINDYSIERPSPKVDALHDLVRDLVDRGVPVHGVGFQTHIVAQFAPSASQMATVLGRFSTMGLETRITEMDVRHELPTTQADLERQAQIYADLVAAAVADPGFAGLTFWGFTDRYSWIPGWFDGYGDALPLDADYERKPAYRAVRDSLEP